MRGENMKTKSKLTDYELKKLYTESDLQVRHIATLAGIGRESVWKRLKRLGVATAGRGTVAVTCAFCGMEFNRYRTRASKTDKDYCNAECYFASRENPGYVPWRHGQRLARALVSQHIRLLPEWVIHHKDGNNKNNDISNLVVFESQKIHLKHHHNKIGIDAALWDGANV